MAGIFFCLNTVGAFFCDFQTQARVCLRNKFWWPKVSNGQHQQRPKPQGAAKRRESSSRSRSISVQCGCWWDRCEWDRCQYVRVFVFVVGFTFFNVPASVHPLAFCGLALWQGCVEGEDLGMTRAAERSGECCGLHSSSLRIVCRMLSQKNDNLSVQKGRRWHGGRYTAHTCPSSRSFPLTLFFSSGWHPECSTSFRPFRVISTSDHTEDKITLP